MQIFQINRYMNSPKVTITVPAHNEAKVLQENILKIRETARSITPNFQIVIAEDGSTDGTEKIAASLAKKYKEIKHLHSDEKLGKGGALRNAFKKFDSDVFVVMDADLSSKPECLNDFMKKINDGCDIVIGSRMAKGAKTRRSFKRAIASRGYNWLARRFFGLNFADLQCGFKAFKGDAIDGVLDKVEENNWFFDTELLVRAKNENYRIEEIPLEWEEKSSRTKVKIGRDSRYMLSKMVKFWWKLKSEKNSN